VSLLQGFGDQMIPSVGEDFVIFCYLGTATKIDEKKSREIVCITRN
jgi:hypothetical protein